MVNIFDCFKSSMFAYLLIYALTVAKNVSLNAIKIERMEVNYLPYSPPTSVWKLIKQHVPVEELSLVRSCIGEAKLDYCTDLQNELDVLLEIWREIQTDAMTPVSSCSSSSSFPEPPNLREMLTKEITLLLDSLREKQNKKIVKPKGSDHSILNYAVQKNKENISRPPSPMERPSTPLRLALEEKENVINDTSIKYVARDINANNIDRVANVLKEALDEECSALLKGIEFVQSCIEDENEMDSRNLPEKEPSIVELRNECKKLEQELLKDAVIDKKANKSLPVMSKPCITPIKRPNSAPTKIIKNLRRPVKSQKGGNENNINNNNISVTTLPDKPSVCTIKYNEDLNGNVTVSDGNTTHIIEMKSIIPVGNMTPRPPTANKPVCSPSVLHRTHSIQQSNPM